VKPCFGKTFSIVSKDQFLIGFTILRDIYDIIWGGGRSAPHFPLSSPLKKYAICFFLSLSGISRNGEWGEHVFYSFFCYYEIWIRFLLLRTDHTHCSWATLFPFVVIPLLCVAYRNPASVLRWFCRVFEVGFVFLSVENKFWFVSQLNFGLSLICQKRLQSVAEIIFHISFRDKKDLPKNQAVMSKYTNWHPEKGC